MFSLTNPQVQGLSCNREDKKTRSVTIANAANDSLCERLCVSATKKAVVLVGFCRRLQVKTKLQTEQAPNWGPHRREIWYAQTMRQESRETQHCLRTVSLSLSLFLSLFFSVFLYLFLAPRQWESKLSLCVKAIWVGMEKTTGPFSGRSGGKTEARLEAVHMTTLQCDVDSGVDNRQNHRRRKQGIISLCFLWQDGVYLKKRGAMLLQWAQKPHNNNNNKCCWAQRN